MERRIVGSMSEWSGVLKDAFRQIDDGSLTISHFQALTEHRNPFDGGDVLDQLISKTEKLLSKHFGKKIIVDRIPAEFTEENLAKWARYNLKPVFLPDEEITENREIKNWVKPRRWFYDKIKEGKIARDSAVLKRGWYLADFSIGVDYAGGIQVFPNDPLVPIIERLREEDKIGKYDKTPMGSRFSIIPRNEYPLVFTELAKELGLKSEQILLERCIEFNAIGNLYDSNRGKFNSWEWFFDAFEDSYRLCGGDRGDGGLADVDRHWSGLRLVNLAGRPLVSFVK